MKKKLFRRIATIATAAALGIGACAMFAGCTSNNPKITITYSFNNKDYEVDYSLSRLDAPNTVKHFIELADAGFYNGTCIHDFQDYKLYMGGYKINDEKELDPIDYFSWVKDYEEKNNYRFTQSVWKVKDDAPLYTVYGEFEENGNRPANGKEYRHKAGALVMYYTPKGNFNYRVKTARNDGGKENDKDPYDTNKNYEYNSATSLFYTFTGEAATADDGKYCVFGMAQDYSQFQELLDAIEEYKEKQTAEDYSFTDNQQIQNVNELEQVGDADFQELRGSKIPANNGDGYETPVEMPVIIKSVKVNKY